MTIRMEMKKNKVYIAGPVSGLPYDEAVKRFAAAEAVLSIDYQVINPTKICRACWSWYRCMVVCLWALRKCNRIALLPGWENSRGARIELFTAILLGKDINI